MRVPRCWTSRILPRPWVSASAAAWDRAPSPVRHAATEARALARQGWQRRQQVQPLAAVGQCPEVAQDGVAGFKGLFALFAGCVRKWQPGLRRRDDTAAAIDQGRILIVEIADVELQPATRVCRILAAWPCIQPAGEKAVRAQYYRERWPHPQPLPAPVVDFACLEIGDRDQFGLRALARGRRFRMIER